MWESNPPVPISETHAALKAGGATGPHALPEVRTYEFLFIKCNICWKIFQLFIILNQLNLPEISHAKKMSFK
ncbi:hypothetical protein DRI50_06945 [candidate division KSB1 bacterium]|nr:MAG: hypothetical protein DRI50_06945 [candidate division KSB1 bacterium]